ncbi:MAG: metallophosphoesterase family protein, partial [Clostridia bacterium]|nr:metallophosphoesterase family protein [Clostridia bacterium]
MKIGIITDVHSNVIALDKVIQMFNAEKCDKIICCGDIIGIGPYP